MTDTRAPTTYIAVFDDVIGATESDHLPIICVTNHPRRASRSKGPMRFDASRIPTEYRLLRDLVAWAESGDLAYANDMSRNAYAGMLDKGLVWCAEPHTMARHMSETATNSGRFGKPKTGEQGLLEPSDLHDLKFIEAALPLATTKPAAKSPRHTVVQAETKDQAAESEAQDTEGE